MSLTDEHGAVNTMILGGQSFDQIEDYINALALPSAQLAALWLLAWTEGTDRETRSRLIAETLSGLGSQLRGAGPRMLNSGVESPESASSNCRYRPSTEAQRRRRRARHREN
jgi:hypothetical protein